MHLLPKTPARTFVPLVLVVAVFGGHTSATETVGPVSSDAADAVVEAALNESFTLPEGAAVGVDEKLGLAFLDVIEESRCPSDVQCVWEGNARISLEATTSGATANLQLDTNLGFETTVIHEGYEIELLELDPYPDSRSRGDAPYEARLIVRAIDASSPVPSLPVD